MAALIGAVVAAAVLVTLAHRVAPAGTASNATTVAEDAEVIPDGYLDLTAGNSLWTALIRNCRRPSMACIEATMHDYLQDTLEYPHDVNFTNFMTFRKNAVDYASIKARSIDEGDDDGGGDGKIEADDDTDEEEPRSDVEEMTRSLHDTGMKFLMTHDLELQLPDAIFEGSTLRVSPRAFEGNGALVKVEFLPKEVAESHGEGRILLKKIKKFIGEKLMYALLAILLVIKLLAMKFMFIMPMMMGAVAAKKLLIKVLLFVFPALHHVFKLCPYVPHGTKYHHHKHQIAHIHHVPHKHHHPHHGHVIEHDPHHETVEVIRPHSDGPPVHLHGHGHHDHPPDGAHWHGPPSIHHTLELDPPYKPLYKPHEMELEYFSGGPALSHNFINHRLDSAEDDNTNRVHLPKNGPGRPLTPSEIEIMLRKAEKEAMIKARLHQEKLKIQEENARLQGELKHALRLQEKLKHQSLLVKTKIQQAAAQAPPPLPSQYSTHNSVQIPPPYAPNLRAPAQLSSQLSPPTPNPFLQKPQLQSTQLLSQPFQADFRTRQETPLPKPQQPTRKVQQDPPEGSKPPQQEAPKPSQQEAFEQALHQAATITYDAFYSPILEKIDKILVGLGFTDEPCRERLICSMYKNPSSFSPHSNLLSAELSRDSKELQKPTTTNAAVVRFYRYVQAARDGQDQRDCLRLYTSCSVDTEQ